MVSGPLPRPVGAEPAESLRFEIRGLRLGADVRVGVAGAVGLAEGVPAGDQRERLLVVHRHPLEGLADERRGRTRVRIAHRTLGVDVDQSHLGGAHLVCHLALADVASLAQPRVLGSPDDLLGLPDVLAAEREAEGLEAHGLQRDVAREDEEVGPGELLAVLLLDRPQQPACLVEVGVVGPAVERCEPLATVPGASAAVMDTIGAGGMPAHPDHQAAVVAEVGRPPVLRGGEDLDDVAASGPRRRAAELLAIAELRAEGIARRVVWRAGRRGRAGWATSQRWSAAGVPWAAASRWPGSRSRCPARSRCRGRPGIHSPCRDRRPGRCSQGWEPGRCPGCQSWESLPYRHYVARTSRQERGWSRWDKVPSR